MPEFVIPKEIDLAIHNILNGLPRRDKIMQISLVIDYIEQVTFILKKQKNQESDFCQELQKVIKKILRRLIPHDELSKIAIDDFNKGNFSKIARKAVACLN